MLNHEIKIPFQSLDLNQKRVTVKKGQILQMQGDSNAKFYYVLSGLLRSYVVNEKGKEHTYMFAPEGWLIGDSFAFFKNEPSQIFIDILED